MKKKIKVVHGTYVENPECKICGNPISHKWLDGDYSLLMCDDQKCFDELNKNRQRITTPPAKQTMKI